MGLPSGIRAQELEVEDVPPIEEEPVERPPDPAADAFPAPADLKDALDRATEAVRAAEERGPDAAQKLQEAVFYVSAAQKYDANNSRASFLNGRMNILIGRPRDAFGQISQYAGSAEGMVDWEALRVLADLYLQSKYYVQAEAKYEQALELNPNEVSIYIGRSRCALSRGRKAEAIDYAYKATQLAPSSTKAWDVYISATHDAGMLEDAAKATQNVIALTQMALRDNPTDAVLLRQLYDRYAARQGVVQSMLQKTVGVGGDLRARVNLTLDYFETAMARTELARLLSFRQMWHTLSAALEAVEPTLPVELVYKFAEISLLTDQSEQAIEVLGKLLTIDPTDTRAAELLLKLENTAPGPASTPDSPPTDPQG
jgi:tetratricopeptide (TPR) repeat protein